MTSVERNLLGQQPWELRGANEARLAALQTDLTAAQSALATAQSNVALLLAPTYLMTGTFTSGSTTSASFVDMPGPPSKTLTKLRADTYFVVHGHLSGWESVAGGRFDVGIRFNSVDHWVSAFLFNNASVHHDMAFVAQLATAAAAGSYAVTLRWRVTSGTAQVNTDDFYHLSFKEGYTA